MESDWTLKTAQQLTGPLPLIQSLYAVSRPFAYLKLLRASDSSSYTSNTVSSFVITSKS